MNPEKWQTVKTLFNQACEQKLDEQESYVRATCTDIAVVAKVLDMLGSENQSKASINLTKIVALSAEDLQSDYARC